MSERVLHEWTDALGDKFRMIDGPRPAGIGFQTSTAETGWEWKPTVLTTIDAGKALLGLLCETRRLSAIFDREKTLRKRDTARVSELEAMYETSHASRMHAEDCVTRLEDENERLRDEVDRQTKAKECYEERQARKEAENAKLRKCVEAADGMRAQIDDYLVPKAHLDEYDAARAEVGK